MILLQVMRPWLKELFNLLVKGCNLAASHVRIDRLIKRKWDSRVSVPLTFRILMDALLPLDFNCGNWQQIDVVIPATEKDFQTLGFAIDSVKKFLLNPVGSILIVLPARDVDEAKLRFGFLDKVVIVNEEDFLPPAVLNACRVVAPQGRLGWTIQQAVKFQSALSSELDAVLILDSDTVLMQLQGFLCANQVQSLSISHEYHLPYQNNYESYLNLEAKSRRVVSFVTHHQLMQKSIVQEFLGGVNSVELGLTNWIMGFDFVNWSPACEYHSYGNFILDNYPEKVRLVRWSNYAYSRNHLPLAGRFDDLCALKIVKKSKPKSISLHSYL